MAAPPRHELMEFLRINNLDYLSPDETEPSPSPFDTLWTEFARSHPRLSPPRSPVLLQSQSQSTSNLHSLYGSHAGHPDTSHPRSTIDLRALEYVTDYDTNLMCPICHVPFIDPIVLDCDHTFCGECFDTYHNSGSGSDRLRCPACRAYHLGGPRRANRLIRNMASDVRVKCPNSGCESIMTRSSMQMHIARECPEHEIPCPIPTCSRQIKRKNFVPDTCIHDTHIECDCGMSIRLGRGEWIRHKDEECPKTVKATPHTSSESDSHKIDSNSCPGADYGCPYADLISHSDQPDLASHISTCAFAKLAPFLQKQEALVKTLQRSLDQQSRRSDIFESAFDRLNDIITNTIQPKLDQITAIPTASPHDNDDTISEIEEIPRSPSSLQQAIYPHHQPSYAQPDPTLSLTLSNLIDRVTNLESQHQINTSDTHRAIRDLDARTSLSLMNETLRIREELAHLNGGMYSTRAQVTYLLNHHRLAGQQAALNGGSVGSGIAAGLARGFSNGTNTNTSTTTTATTAGQPGQSGSAAQSQPQTQSQNITTHLPPMSTSIASGSGGGSGNASTATSPNLNPIFNTARPNLRRGSGGSASGSRSSIDRVKL